MSARKSAGESSTIVVVITVGVLTALVLPDSGDWQCGIPVNNCTNGCRPTATFECDRPTGFQRLSIEVQSNETVSCRYHLDGLLAGKCFGNCTRNCPIKVTIARDSLVIVSPLNGTYSLKISSTNRIGDPVSSRDVEIADDCNATSVLNENDGCEPATGESSGYEPTMESSGYEPATGESSSYEPTMGESSGYEPTMGENSCCESAIGALFIIALCTLVITTCM